MFDSNVLFNWKNNSKFNTVAILISFINKRNEENIAKYALLSSVLGSVTKNYDTKRKLNKKMYDLYNCNIYFSSLNMYKNENLSLFVNFVNPDIVNDEKLLDNIFELMKEFLYNQLLNGDQNGFEVKNFNEKKRLILEEIDSLYNNKSKYSTNQLLEKMRRENEYPLSNGLKKEDVEKTTANSLYEFYKEILDNSFVCINGMGNIDSKIILNKFKDFNFKSKNIDIETFSKIDFELQECKYFEEIQNVEQAKLRIGFRTYINNDSPLYPAYVVFHSMFGGIFNSTLSRVIREEKSLAYSVYSSILVDRKLFIVSCGVDSDKINEVEKTVLELLETYKNNNIEDGEQLFKMAKECILNDMMQVYDTQGALLLRNLKDSITSLCKYDDLIKRIYNVKLEEVVEASKQIYLDTIFVLKGKENGSI